MEEGRIVFYPFMKEKEREYVVRESMDPGNCWGQMLTFLCKKPYNMATLIHVGKCSQNTKPTWLFQALAMDSNWQQLSFLLADTSWIFPEIVFLHTHTPSYTEIILMEENITLEGNPKSTVMYSLYEGQLKCHKVLSKQVWVFQTLLSKLSSFGIRRWVILWVNNWLNSWKQQVKING